MGGWFRVSGRAVGPADEGAQVNDVVLRWWCDAVNRAHEVRSGQRGATAVEYAILVALIAGVILVVVRSVGLRTSGAFQDANKGW
jgi:Flp pilus assembly pilin Flp